MTCYKTELVQYVIGTLDKTKQETITSHIKTCKQCAAKVAEIEKVTTSTKNLFRADCIDINLLEKFPDKIKSTNIRSKIETHLESCKLCREELELIHSNPATWQDEKIEIPPIENLLSANVISAITDAAHFNAIESGPKAEEDILKSTLYALAKNYFQHNPLPEHIEFEKLWNLHFSSLQWGKIILKPEDKRKYLEQNIAEIQIINTFGYIIDHFHKKVEITELKKEVILRALEKSGAQEKIMNKLSDYLANNLTTVIKEKYEKHIRHKRTLKK